MVVMSLIYDNKITTIWNQLSKYMIYSKHTDFQCNNRSQARLPEPFIAKWVNGVRQNAVMIKMRHRLSVLIKQLLPGAVVVAAISACSTVVGENYGGATPNQAVNDAQCKKYANEYVRTHGIDKNWRQQEFYTQYRICMNRAAEKT